MVSFLKNHGKVFSMKNIKEPTMFGQFSKDIMGNIVNTIDNHHCPKFENKNS